MVFLLPLALLQSSLAQAPTAGGWTALPTPVLCQARLLSPVPAPLASGSHLLQPADALERARSDAERVALDGDAPEDPRGFRRERARSALEFFKSASSLLVRGEPAAARRRARARILELDRAAEALAIDLDVDLAGTAGGAGSASPDRLAEKRRVLSGDEVFFGERRTTGFVMGFNVEVAADSGIAAPVLGTATYGHNLHLRAVRVDGGRRIQIQGSSTSPISRRSSGSTPRRRTSGSCSSPRSTSCRSPSRASSIRRDTRGARRRGCARAAGLEAQREGRRAPGRPRGDRDARRARSRLHREGPDAAPGRRARAELDRLAQFTAPARPPRRDPARGDRRGTRLPRGRQLGSPPLRVVWVTIS
jgi:hypothetical protein